jgi:WD40 repeat protein
VKRRAKYWLGGTLAVVVLSTTTAWVLRVEESSHAAPAFAMHFEGTSIESMRFSPDSRSLAIQTAETELGGTQAIHRSRIYRVVDGSLVHEFKGGAWLCAWHSESPVFAVASSSGEEATLWDTKTWALKRKLSVGFPTAARNSATLLDSTMTQLCFDHQGSLYAALLVDTDIGGNIEPFDRARVWWNASEGKGEIRAEQIGTCGVAFDVSTAFLDPDTRVAISCMGPAAAIEIFRVKRGVGTARPVQPEYNVVDIGAAEAPTSCPSICLTRDGQYLVVRTLERCRTFRLFNDHAQLLWSKDDKLEYGVMRGSLGNVVDVSSDGRLAAYLATSSVKLLQVEDGKEVFVIPRERYTHIALSPDGTLLAVENPRQHCVSFFSTPGVRGIDRKRGTNKGQN